MAVTPLHKAKRVKEDGTNLPMERSSSLSRRAATIWRARLRREMRSGPCNSIPFQRRGSNKTGQYGFTRPSHDPGLHHNLSTRRQIDVNPAAEADNAKSFASAHPFSLGQIADDPSGHKTGDLHHRKVLGL